MQYIRVQGKDHLDALKNLRSQYGNDAIILMDGPIKANGFFNKIVGKEQYEIKACLPEKKNTSTVKKNIETLESMLTKQAKVQEKTSRIDQMLSKEITAPLANENLDEQKAQFLSKFQSLIKKDEGQNKDATVHLNSGDAGTHRGTANYPKMDNLHQDIQFIKQNLSQLAISNDDQRIQEEFAPLFDELRQQDFSPEFCREFIAELKTIVPMSEWRFAKRLAIRARDLLKNRIKAQPTLGKRRIVAFVGPTGVGKTTNLAKIAQKIKFVDKRAVHMVTVDNFRIAATQQLKIYADIMMIPFNNCKNPEQFAEIVENSAEDVILVDTSGFSHKNLDLLTRQRELFNHREYQLESVLVVSAGYKPADLKEIFEKFSIYNISKVLLTKLDESNSVGHVIEICDQHNLPFCFYSSGQNVPEDIMDATADFLANRVFKKYLAALEYQS